MKFRIFNQIGNKKYNMYSYYTFNVITIQNSKKTMHYYQKQKKQIK